MIESQINEKLKNVPQVKTADDVAKAAEALKYFGDLSLSPPPVK